MISLTLKATIFWRMWKTIEFLLYSNKAHLFQILVSYWKFFIKSAKNDFALKNLGFLCNMELTLRLLSKFLLLDCVWICWSNLHKTRKCLNVNLWILLSWFDMSFTNLIVKILVSSKVPHLMISMELGLWVMDFQGMVL